MIPACADIATWTMTSRATARRGVLGLLAPLLLLGAALPGCSRMVGCSEPSVRQALERALDDLYADARKLAKVGVRITDIVAVDQSAKQASCKALVHLSVDFAGIQKEERDTTIPYVAETTEQGRTLVTLAVSR